MAADSDDAARRRELTARPDKRRPGEPLVVDVAGRALALGGEYELFLTGIRRRVYGTGIEEPDRIAMEHQLELEAYYGFGRSLSLFAQLRAKLEEDLLGRGFDDVSDAYVERGELWLYADDIAGTPFDLDVGRLHFEDARRFWWDDDLDAIRARFGAEPLDVSLAVARELAPARSDRSRVDPLDERVLRVLGHAAWSWRRDHVLEGFALHQDDRSRTEPPGAVARLPEEDESDARLSWLGARPTGEVAVGSRARLQYAFEAAVVSGEERLVAYEAISPSRGRVTGVERRDVSGWAIDASLLLTLAAAAEPRLYLGYAFGSGDRSPGAGTDRAFRQTSLQANEPDLGGSERYSAYGVLLQPELSNLRIASLGAGVSLGKGSSLDLVYHGYALVERATELRAAGLEASLSGADRDVGQELDLILALEEWERLEFTLLGGAFRAGSAFGRQRGDWSYGGSLAVRIAF